MPASLFRLLLLGAALAFGYGLLALPSGAAVATRDWVDGAGGRTVCPFDAAGRKHGEELVFAPDGRLKTRIVWDGGQWVESCAYHANGQPHVRSHDRFPWGIMRCEEFDEAGRLVARQEW